MKQTIHTSKTSADSAGILDTTVVTKEIDSILENYFRDQKSRALRHTSHTRLWEYLEMFVMQGGKRIRPYLVVIAAMSKGTEPKPKVYQIAAAWELIHQAMLVHDDIIDRDYVRRGMPNVSGHYNEYYQTVHRQLRDVNHYVDSAAILAGDLLISGAYQMINDAGLTAQEHQNISRIFTRAIENVIMGELQDTEAVMDKIGTAQPLLIAELKTASYSFVGPLKTGAILAGLDEIAINSYESFGAALGIAFQLRDDWLGLFGDSSITGKSIDNDVREGKQTILIEYAYEQASDEQKKQFDAVVGKHDATEAEVAHVRELVRNLGAQNYIESLIASYTAEAQDQLSSLTIDGECKTILALLSDQLLQRQN